MPVPIRQIGISRMRNHIHLCIQRLNTHATEMIQNRERCDNNDVIVSTVSESLCNLRGVLECGDVSIDLDIPAETLSEYVHLPRKGLVLRQPENFHLFSFLLTY
jgi:hypothetical protein